MAVADQTEEETFKSLLNISGQCSILPVFLTLEELFSDRPPLNVFVRRTALADLILGLTLAVVCQDWAVTADQCSFEGSPVKFQTVADRACQGLRFISKDKCFLISDLML